MPPKYFEWQYVGFWYLDWRARNPLNIKFFGLFSFILFHFFASFEKLAFQQGSLSFCVIYIHITFQTFARSFSFYACIFAVFVFFGTHAIVY